MLMLLFNIGDDTYACESEPIVEVVPRVKLKKIPHAPDCLAGLMNYSGMPVPVIDLCQLILQRPANPQMHTRIIIVKSPHSSDPHQLIGLIVERATKTIERDDASFIESGVKFKLYSYLGGVSHDQDEAIQRFHMDQFFEVIQKLIGSEKL